MIIILLPSCKKSTTVPIDHKINSKFKVSLYTVLQIKLSASEKLATAGQGMAYERSGVSL